jgi:hypothetical protein
MGGRLHPGRVAGFTSESPAGFARNTQIAVIALGAKRLRRSFQEALVIDGGSASVNLEKKGPQKRFRRPTSVTFVETVDVLQSN